MGMTQDGFAAAGAIGKRALIHYEKAERSPDAAFLAAIAAAGADVLYILTGQRAPVGALEAAEPGASYTFARTPRERALLDNYRASPDAGRRVIEGAATLAAQSSSGKNKPLKKRRGNAA